MFDKVIEALDPFLSRIMQEGRAKEEREAWDRYYAAVVGADICPLDAAAIADEMLVERHKRFPLPNVKSEELKS